MTGTRKDGGFALLFDMDGVLVDVSQSFRRVIRAVVREIAGEDVDPSQIQALKEKGGFNDDVVLSAELLRRTGREVPLDEVRSLFDALYLGDGDRGGLWENERWLAPAGLLRRLASGRRVGVVTGRTREEVDRARRIAGEAWDVFECVVTQDDIPAGRGKPAPDSILAAMHRLSATSGAYVGDAVDDMRAARAAGVRAIGVLPPGTGAGERLGDLMMQCGAEVVLASISDLEGHL